nr:hypothetical protein [Methylobacterium sp. L1A1]
MPHHDTVALEGTIEHVFAHRFTLTADSQTHLADLTPKGVEAFPLQAGLHVSIAGERRPSEIKVTRIAADGRDPVTIEHKKPHHGPSRKHPDMPADPGHVLGAVKAAGWTPDQELRRKPKHFEVLARQDNGPWTELHVDFAGTIYKRKPADAEKWGLAV